MLKDFLEMLADVAGESLVKEIGAKRLLVILLVLLAGIGIAVGIGWIAWMILA
ncbi:MAG: hypothetical protein IJ468_04105 [Lachnospiraceae bacterium]|nr:hypothetical protein [Lachnospiraceae bacterium]